MTPFFIYLVKSSICLALFYIVFRLAMSRDKNHSLNRFILLGIMVASAIIPLLNFQFFKEETIIQPVNIVRDFIYTPLEIVENSEAKTIARPVATTIEINWWLLAYSVAIACLFSRLIISMLRIFQLVRGSKKVPLKKMIIAVINEIIQPFSFLRYIVISEKDYTNNNNAIIAHEQEHIRQMHAIDLIFVELFSMLHWFNPFTWLLRRDLKMVHEFQADQAVLNTGIDAKKYQLLVIKKAVGERRFALANSFTQKPIKKRIHMMMKECRKESPVKLIFFLPLLMILLQAFARPGIISKWDDFIPVIYSEDESAKWLQRWTVDNMGRGFFQPEVELVEPYKDSANVLNILLNYKNELLVENQPKDQNDLKRVVKNFLHGINPAGGQSPDFVEKEIPFIGNMKVWDGYICLQHDTKSKPEIINPILKTIGEAFLELRNEKAQILFDKKYFDLNREKHKAVDKTTPVRFIYEYPVLPPPSVWVPFEGKYSDSPKPFNITVKRNGNIFIQNYKCDSVQILQEILKEWQNGLATFNRGHIARSIYRANLEIEEGVPESLYDKVDLALLQGKIRIEKRSGKGNEFFSQYLCISSVLEDNDIDFKKILDSIEDYKKKARNISAVIHYKKGVRAETKNDVKKVYQEAGIKNVEFKEYIPPKPAPLTFLLRLSPDKIQTAILNEITMEDVQAETKRWLEMVKVDKYKAKIEVSPGVSKKRVNQVKTEMQKGGIVAEIEVRKVDS